MSLLSTAGLDAALVDFFGNCTKRRHAVSLQILFDLGKFACEAVRIVSNIGSERSATFPRPPERRGAIRVAEPHAPRLDGRQRLFRATRDGLALLLRDEAHYADHEIIRVGHVAGNELFALSRSVSRKARCG